MLTRASSDAANSSHICMEFQVNTFAAANKPGPAARKRVLVVDDHAVNRLILARAVESAGATAEMAEDGEHALRMLDEARFDLVFMDISMPVLDGIEATRRARAGGCAMPFVAVTALYTPGEFSALGPFGFDGLICKPFDLAEVVGWVRDPGGAGGRRA
jgi:CheY-like chemotaxis protein